VLTNSASQEYRFVVRGVDEDILQTVSGGDALLQITPTAGVWTEFSIPDVLVEDNSQIILRIANINVSGNPAIFYVDDGAFNEGQAPTTVGQMWLDMYDSFVDPALRTPILWDDGTTTDTPYLTNDFDATNASDGVAWVDSAVSLTFRPRMTGGQILAEFVRLGYEWRVVPDVTDGYYLLQLYNPGTLGAVVAAGIQTGAADIRRNARYFSPAATDLMVQGQGHLSSRASNAGLVSAFGRIEGSTLDLNITSTVDAQLAAVDGVAANNRGAESLVYTLRPYTGVSEPLIDYRPGDEISIEDPGVVSGTRRVSQIELAWDKTGAEYTIYLGSVALVGQTAVNQSVYDLLTRFERADEVPQPAGVSFTGGGGAPTVVIADSGSSGFSQGRADFIWGLNFGAVQFQNLLDAFGSLGARILWTEGDFTIDAHIDVPTRVNFEGMGSFATILRWGNDPDITWAGNNGARHIQFTDTPS
jgi:hypothetical protein